MIVSSHFRSKTATGYSVDLTDVLTSKRRGLAFIRLRFTCRISNHGQSLLILL